MVMALLHLPHQSPFFSAPSNSRNHCLSSTNFSFISSLSHSRTNSICLIRHERFRRFITHLSVAAHDPVAELQPQSGNQEEEESSRTKLIAENVPWTCTVEDIRSLFEKHGKVLDVELSMHNKTLNRGLASISMASPEDALTALNNLRSYEFDGRVLRLDYARARKKKAAPPVQPKPAVTFNLFVSNFSYDARGKDLKEYFESEGGEVVSAHVIFRENPRMSTGYGFVAFKSKKQAEAALESFQGKMFMRRQIRVARAEQFIKVQLEDESTSDETTIDSGSVSEQAEVTDER